MSGLNSFKNFKNLPLFAKILHVVWWAILFWATLYELCKISSCHELEHAAIIVWWAANAIGAGAQEPQYWSAFRARGA